MRTLLFVVCIGALAGGCKKKESTPAAGSSSGSAGSSTPAAAAPGGAPAIVTVTSVEPQGTDTAHVKVEIKNKSTKKIGSVTYMVCLYASDKSYVAEDQPSQGMPLDPGATGKADDDIKPSEEFRSKIKGATAKVLPVTVFFADDTKWEIENGPASCDKTPGLMP